jgi:tRNA1Val (adenine37-N6)-methyltransferase
MTLFRFKQFGIEQNLSAMKVGTDGVLLGAWSGKHLQSNKKNSDQKFLDIGTGTGLITLMLAQRFENAVIDAIEIDENAVKQAEINIKNSPWSNRIQIYKSSLQDFICNPPSHYDLIVCNPPYFSNGWKVSDKQRELARHTKHLTAFFISFYFSDILLHFTNCNCRHRNG